MLSDGTLTLRAIEPSDIEAMYIWENDTTLWHLGDTNTPFSRATIRAFIESTGQDIYTTRQVRLIIQLGERAIGAVDLFDFSPQHHRAAFGILIYEERDRGKGYASRAVELLTHYAFKILRIKQLYAHVPVSNLSSLAMCRRGGFTPSGTLREWTDGQDVVVMQLLADDFKNQHLNATQ